MGNSRPKWAASNADLDKAAEIALRAADVLRELAHGAEMLGTALAAALDGARPARFALGDVSLCVPNGVSFVMLNVKREILTEKLQNRYGCTFKVRIRQQL